MSFSSQLKGTLGRNVYEIVKMSMKHTIPRAQRMHLTRWSLGEPGIWVRLRHCREQNCTRGWGGSQEQGARRCLLAVCRITEALPHGLINDGKLINRCLTSDGQALWVGSAVQGH